jgi:hypothetical protein
VNANANTNTITNTAAADRRAMRALQSWLAAVVRTPAGVEHGLRTRDARRHLRAAGASRRTVVATPRPDFDTVARLQVYGYAYGARLVEVLAGDYPATRERLGVTRFDRCAYAYVEAHPSRHPNLVCFGADFAAFLRRRSDVPAFAAHLARLELAITTAFDAPAAAVPAVPAEAMATLAPEQWQRARLVLDPSVRCLRLPAAIADWFARWRGGEEVPNRARAVDLCLWRRNGEVRRTELPRAAARVLRAIARGERLTSAVGRAPVGSPIGTWFAQWRSDGLVVGLRDIAALAST